MTLLLILSFSVFAQNPKSISEEDKKALEGIVIEKYYVATKEDAKDTVGGILKAGSTTYRIYVDLKPGYHLQAVFGVEKHPFFYKTSTLFFNNTQGGAQSADQIFESKLNENSVALDSWVTIGAATRSTLGVVKTEDTDSSVIKREQLAKVDGMLKAATIQKLLYYGLDLSFFGNNKNASFFYSNNGSLATVGGGKGATKDNKVLIAQLTTDGKLSFELNLQVGTPTCGIVQYVAKNPEGQEILFKQLTRK